MHLIEPLFIGFLLVMAFFTLVWIASVVIKNASIVDIFWGLGFIVISCFYYYYFPGNSLRKDIILGLAILWGLRLSLHIAFRNWGKGEDPRYTEFRQHYGANRYWWFSYFQVFLLQGFLLSIISLTLLEGMSNAAESSFPKTLEWMGLILWAIGFYFESVGDYQLVKFKANKKNEGKVMDKGLWKYTRHPNYFGEALLWWGYGLISLQYGTLLALTGPVIMTFLLLKVSGVSMLERNLKKSKPEYADYIRKTSSFIPWLPKR